MCEGTVWGKTLISVLHILNPSMGLLRTLERQVTILFYEAKLQGIAFKKTKRKLTTNTSSRQSRHVQDCMSLWQSDNQVHVNFVSSKRRLTGHGMVVVQCVWHRYHQPQEWLLNNDGHWQKQPRGQQQENAATLTGCSHVSTLAKTTWILWMQTIVYECLMTYNSSGLAGTPEDITYNLQ